MVKRQQKKKLSLVFHPVLCCLVCERKGGFKRERWGEKKEEGGVCRLGKVADQGGRGEERRGGGGGGRWGGTVRTLSFDCFYSALNPV